MREVQQQLNFKIDELSDEELYRRMSGEYKRVVITDVAVPLKAIAKVKDKKRNRKSKKQKRQGASDMSAQKKEPRIVYKITVDTFEEDAKGELRYLNQEAVNIKYRTPLIDSNLGIWLLNTMNKQAKRAKEQIIAADKRYWELMNE